MLKELGKHFDHYTINARFLPAFFSILPFVLTMLAWCPSAKTIMGSSLTVLISFGVMTFISTFISNLGNKVQDKLFLIWGGAPTTIILRHADGLLDKYTKQRYHKWIDEKVDSLSLPVVEDEIKEPLDADMKYQSATNFLREFTRDKKKHPAVYRDNVSYGFSRNLLAIRYFGLLVSFMCVVMNSYLVWLANSIESAVGGKMIISDYFFGIGAGFVSIIFLAAFCFIVNNDFVKVRGFRYARTLFESCEVSHKGNNS